VAGSCGLANKPSSCRKGGEFHEQPDNCQRLFLKKNSYLATYLDLSLYTFILAVLLEQNFTENPDPDLKEGSDDK
jgi:hypothetical protein